MTPQEVAAELRSLAGAMDDAARGIDHNKDLLDIDWGTVDRWIDDLRRIQEAVDRDGMRD